jgi:hypothetical protein
LGGVFVSKKPPHYSNAFLSGQMYFPLEFSGVINRPYLVHPAAAPLELLHSRLMRFNLYSRIKERLLMLRPKLSSARLMNIIHQARVLINTERAAACCIMSGRNSLSRAKKSKERFFAS